MGTFQPRMTGARRGAFIVLEGLDRSGKSTQCARLVEVLNARGKRAKAIKFPDRTTATGRMIDAYLGQRAELDGRAIHLLFSANRWELAYAFSGIAFSAAKGLDYSWCRSPDIGLPSPDLVLFLDLSSEIAAQRGGYGAERYETEAMQAEVRKVFARIGEEMGAASGGPSASTTKRRSLWRTVDAGRSMEEVASEVQREAWEVVEREKGEIVRLFEE